MSRGTTRAALALTLGMQLLRAIAINAQPLPPPTTDGVHPCQPVRAEKDALPSLQQGLEAACRRFAGDGLTEAGGLASRLQVRIGGWLDGSFRDNDFGVRGSAWEVDHVNLHLDARLDERFQLFVEGEYEAERDATGFDDEREVELEQAFLGYAHTDGLQARVGRFSIPFGYWTPVHWSINVDTLEAPIHEANRVIPEQQLGGRLFGRLFPAQGHALEPEIEYSIYAGYGEEHLETGKPDGFSVGGDVRLWLRGEHLIGASYYTQRNDDLRDRREHNAMLYAQLALPYGFLARAEYLHQWRAARPGYAKRADIVYAKLRWDFHRRAYANYRYNFGEDDAFGRTVDHSIHTLTLGLRPIPRVLAKFETNFHDIDRGIESYVSWGASLGLIF